jgi:uncharacterized protein YdeI (YjbR/CyaY-like superfamily)
VGVELPELCVVDAAAWRAWLQEHHAGSEGVWLVLAKKRRTQPTSVTYDEALDEAVCFGWIDGQIGRRDDDTYRQRFTPRRPRSAWSKSNVDRVARLGAEGRMHPAGAAAVERAKAGGEWDRAYAGSAAIEVPDDLALALAADPAARAAFDGLSRQNRYSVLYRIQQAKRAETRARRIAAFVDTLRRGETLYPQ